MSRTKLSLLLLNSVAKEALEEDVEDKITFGEVGQYVTLGDAKTS